MTETVVLFSQMRTHWPLRELVTIFYTKGRLQHQVQTKRKKLRARHRKHPTGRDIALVEVLHHMLGEADVRTTLKHLLKKDPTAEFN